MNNAIRGRQFETEAISKFFQSEEYVVEKITPFHFNYEWDESLFDPDIVIRMLKGNFRLNIECKCRNINYAYSEIKIIKNDQQLNRYKSRDNCFVLLKIVNKSEELFYFIPAEKIKTTSVPLEFIKKFEIRNRILAPSYIKNRFPLCHEIS